MIIVTIERDECVSCGQCWASFPEFFEEDPDDGRRAVAGWWGIAQAFRL